MKVIRNYLYDGPTLSFTKGEKYSVLDNQGSMWLVRNDSGAEEWVSGDHFKQIIELTDDFIEPSCKALSKLYPRLEEEEIKNILEQITCDVRRSKSRFSHFDAREAKKLAGISDVNVIKPEEKRIINKLSSAISNEIEEKLSQIVSRIMEDAMNQIETEIKKAEELNTHMKGLNNGK